MMLTLIGDVEVCTGVTPVGRRAVAVAHPHEALAAQDLLDRALVS